MWSPETARVADTRRAVAPRSILSRALRAGALLCTAVLLASCGFAPRQAPELALKRISLRGFERSSGMAEELRRQLRASPGASVVEPPQPADAVVTALQDKLERVVAASTAAGQVSELTLRARLRFEVRDSAGHLLIPSTELLISRDMSYSESAALAKEHEARLMTRAMQSELANQLVRRLAALPAPGAALPPAGAAATAASGAASGAVPARAASSP
jgi:LPS-assembly lipoprotein